MQHTLNKILDILYPPRETQYALRTHNSGTTLLNSGCHQGIFFCTQYTHPIVGAAVIENKFYNNHSAQIILAQCVSDWVHTKQLKNVCIVPIPLGKKRLKSRGHNQVISVAKLTNYPVHHSLLSRTTETLPQASLDKHQRQRNIKNVFSCDTDALSKLTHSIIVLLDDVVTTGATLKEARVTLTPHLPPTTKLICLAIAH